MTAKHLLSEIVAGLDGVTPGLVERLRSNGALPICPFEKRSPEYWTTPNDKPCKFCGGLPEGPDKCTGADMRIMGEAADRIEQLERELADARRQPEGLSKWDGWDQSNLPWSHCHHQDAVCAAVFGPTWSMEDAHALISFIDRTWGTKSQPHSETRQEQR